MLETPNTQAPRVSPENGPAGTAHYLFQAPARFFRVLPEDNPALPTWQRELWRAAGRIPKRGA